MSISPLFWVEGESVFDRHVLLSAGVHENTLIHVMHPCLAAKLSPLQYFVNK